MSQTIAEVNEYLTEAFDHIEAEAKRLNCEVVYSTESTLLLDLDSGAQRDQYERMLKRIKLSIPDIHESANWPSKSGRGLHVVLTLPAPHSPAERIALQCALGSDPVREMLGIALLRAGVENPIVLFKPLAAEAAA